MNSASFYRVLFIATLLFCGLEMSFAQEDHIAPTGIHRHYSTDDGLSHSGVMCILQDHVGFMWFGTWDGLNKFDGYKFTTYKSKPGDINSLSHNRIDDIKEDKYGFLWVKTYDENIHRFDRKSETFQTVTEILPIAMKGNNFTRILRTQKGNIWLLTQNSGCFRVTTDSITNSFKVEKYAEAETTDNRIPGNIIFSIHEDAYSNTWILTNKGVRCVSENKYNSFLQRINGQKITCLMETRGELWFSAENGNVYTLNLKTSLFEVIRLPKNPHIVCSIKLSAEKILFGTNEGELIEWNISTNAYRRISLLGLTGFDTKINSLYIDSYGIVWVETNKTGIVRFNPKDFTVKRFLQKTDKVSPFVYYGDYFTVFEDKNGFLWINLKGGGFCYYNRTTDNVEYFYNEPASINRKFSNLVTFAMADANGNLWLSTHTRGIEKICFIKEKFRFYQPAAGSQVLSANEVRALYEDKNGILWISTKEGKLYCYSKDRKRSKVFSAETQDFGDISFSGMVYSIIQDRTGAMWFGTKGDGIIRAVPVGNPTDFKFKIEHYRYSPRDSYSINNNWVYSIFEDSKGRIWVGTYGGGVNLIENKQGKLLFLHSGNVMKNYPHTICDKVRHLQEDTLGNIWFGSTNGLVIFNPNKTEPSGFKFNLYQKKPGDKSSLANNDVHFVLRSHSGVMWVSTFGGGIGKALRMGENSASPDFEMYTTENGLPIDIVLSMLEDEKGNLWLSTENGLSKFNPNTKEFVNFSELDGIKRLIFSEAACYKNEQGELFFGSFDGYYSFLPRRIVKENRSPKIIIVNFQLFNRDVVVGEKNSPLSQSITSTKAITLKYNQSVFSIEFAGLDYRYSEKLEYAFILEGFETTWNYVRHQRKATYTNLPAGKYVFKVKCSSTGVFDDTEYQQIEIRILPPWWKTVWAYVGYFVLLIVLIFLTRRIILEIIHLRNKVIIEHKLSELKLRFFTNISHELRTPLTLIIGPTEDLLKKGNLNEDNRYFLQIIDKNARRLLRHVNQLLDFRKMETGNMRLKITELELVSFVKDIYSGFTELAYSKKIDFKFFSNTEKCTIWVDSEKLDTLLFNLLSNAFKFTPEGKKIEVGIACQAKEGLIRISIADEGVGISKDELPLIFNRFAVSNNAKGMNSKGTGIGLSLVKEIINLHKGNIQVESKEGVGTTFFVELQLGKGHFDSAGSDIEFIAAQPKKHAFEPEDVNILKEPEKTSDAEIKKNLPVILIVEDNSDLRQYICRSLKTDYNVIEAVDGEVGLQKARELVPDLVISDIMMPVMDGIQLLDNLRNDFKTSHIPIILLTAKSAVENVIEGIKYGADAYITKPFSIEFLHARVYGLIEQRKKLMAKYTNHLKVMELSPDEVIVTARDEQFLKEVIKIIENNISDSEFNVEKIAQAVSLGRTTFFKKIKSLTGFAPVEFMREIKLKRGYQLLETSEYTISEIAFMLGFSDAGYFTKCFKEKYNTTPTEVLRLHKNK